MTQTTRLDHDLKRLRAILWTLVDLQQLVVTPDPEARERQRQASLALTEEAGL